MPRNTASLTAVTVQKFEFAKSQPSHCGTMKYRKLWNDRSRHKVSK